MDKQKDQTFFLNLIIMAFVNRHGCFDNFLKYYVLFPMYLCNKRWMFIVYFIYINTSFDYV